MIFKDWANKNDIPTIDFLTDKTLKYIKEKDWYKNSNKLIKEFYPQDHKLFIDILAITSPLTHVKLNLLNTVQTVDSIKYKRVNNIVYGLANKWIKHNLDKYSRTKRFSGIKINNFAKSLRLIDGSVCIDTWMLKAFNLKRDAPTKYDVKYITRVVKDIADKLNLKTYEVQACLWVYAKTEINHTKFKESHDFSYYLKSYFAQTKLHRWTK